MTSNCPFWISASHFQPSHSLPAPSSGSFPGGQNQGIKVASHQQASRGIEAEFPRGCPATVTSEIARPRHVCSSRWSANLLVFCTVLYSVCGLACLVLSCVYYMWLSSFLPSVAPSIQSKSPSLYFPTSLFSLSPTSTSTLLFLWRPRLDTDLARHIPHS